MVVRQLVRDEAGSTVCPECGNLLEVIEGQPVTVVDGKLNMEDTETHYECHHCHLSFRRLLQTDYFTAGDLPPKEHKHKHKKLVKATGTLEPMRLVRDAKGECECPRCGAVMQFVEGQPVRIVDGKLNMQDVLDHFSCPSCQSVYRRIAGTDYFQWHEE